MADIRKILESGNAVVVCDANVYLHVYSYSPDYSEYAISCLEAIKEFLRMPAMIEIEYNKHRNKCYKEMSNRIKNAKNNYLRQIAKAKNDSLSVSINMKKLGFEEIEELDESIEGQYDMMIKKVEDYFAERSNAMEMISNSWREHDRVYEVYCFMQEHKQILPAFSLVEIYRLCEDGKKRYSKSQPPGYKDNNKDGICKYGDLIWWKEVIKYAKNNKKNIVLVTDDVKEDWWIQNEDGELQLKNELIKEFEKTGQIIIPFSSREFFKMIGREYNVDSPDMVQCALNLTDEDYCERISERVFDMVIEEIVYNGMDYIDTENSHIGSLGIDEFEIDYYQYERGEQVNREDEDVYYILDYTVKISGYSHDYFGRDDETKEVIMSPGSYHEFEGTIQVAIRRQADIFVDFENEDSFEDAEVVEGSLEETLYEPWSENDEDYCEDAYDMCSKCGKKINHENDAGNGLCLACSDEE